jgi:ubiquinone/menaquinone biosynthesis C-methylase UbiE
MANDAAFVGSVPEYYDRGFGPVLFQGYADDMAARAAALAPQRVLETAAGTGIVTRALRDALKSPALLTSTDLNPPMLEVAKAKFAHGERVAFRPADATALPFADGSFDLVVCQFGMMFYPDKPKSLAEVQRVLTPGGHYLFSVWDSHKHNAHGRICQAALDRLVKDPPQFYRVPFSLSAIDPVKEMLIDAGFADIAIEVVHRESPIADLRYFAESSVRANPLAGQLLDRGEDPERVIAAFYEDLAAEIGETLRMPMQAMIYSARKP